MHATMTQPSLTVEKEHAQLTLEQLQRWPHWSTIGRIAEREYGLAPAEFERLLPEYQKFLVLCKLYPGSIGMYSDTIDKVWHSHLLQTQLYAECCEGILGRFIHHVPNLGRGGAECTTPDDICSDKPCDTAPPTPAPKCSEKTYSGDADRSFAHLYLLAFGQRPPAEWHLSLPDALAH